MGRFGWIALTGVAMAGGVLIHSDTFREGVIISDHRFADRLKC